MIKIGNTLFCIIKTFVKSSKAKNDCFVSKHCNIIQRLLIFSVFYSRVGLSLSCVFLYPLTIDQEEH